MPRSIYVCQIEEKCRMNLNLTEQKMKPDSDLPSSGSALSPLRRYLGNGPVADVVLWRRPYTAASLLLAASLIWILFDRLAYSFLSLLSNVILLSVSILFFWAKAANLLNRPLPPVPNLEIPDETVDKAADAARIFVNQVLTVAHDIAIRRDAKLLLQVILALWVVSYIGSLFSFLTLFFLGVTLVLTIPALYEKYQHVVHEKLGFVQAVVLPWYNKFDDMVISKFFMSPNMQKKTQ